MLEVDSISYTIAGKAILGSVSFSLKEGETALILGASGTGKTTMLAIIAGLLKPSSGEVHYAKQSLHELSDVELDKFRGQNLGIIFQNHHLIKPLTVLQNLKLGLSFNDKKVEEKKILETLERLNLSSKAHQKAATLSMGEAQRLAVARAIIGQPKWVLCDEPTSALDDANAKVTLDLLQSEAKACDAGLIIVTHDIRVESHFSAKKIIELEAA